MTAAPTPTPAQQAAAITRAGENLVLRSGAGCGKTFVLATRFTELLMREPEADDPLAGLVALTFTDKAGLEMQQRVRRFLASRAARSRGADRRRLLGWLDDIAGAKISTIHSFCASILRAHAIDAGLDPAFEVCADTLVTDRMTAAAADEAVLAAVEEQRGEVLRVIAREGYDRATALVAELVHTRTAWRREDYADAEATLERWRRLAAEALGDAFARLGADTALREELAELASVPCADPGDKLLPLRNALVAAMRELLADVGNWTPDRFAVLTETKLGRAGGKQAWADAGGAKAMRDAIKAQVARFAGFAYLAEEPGEADKAPAGALATLTALAADANRRYAAAKRAAGRLDFTDLLAETHRLLADNAAVRRDVAAGIVQILVDECQDTDAFQVELLDMLARPSGGGTIPPGRLFVVGDKKQSIYRFRGAQVEVFEALCDRLGPRQQESLKTSFRTHTAGVAFDNELFGRLMGTEYEAIEAHRAEVPQGPSVEILLAEPNDSFPLEGAADAARLQAAATAERIRAMVDGGERGVWDREAGNWRPARYGDMAVLFARMTESLAYEQELARRDVPYYVVAGTGFFRQQEVFDVLNALRVIDNPFDDVALFGVLRSGLFGLDDGVLMRIAGAVGRPALPALRDVHGQIAGLSEARQRTMAVAVELLDELHRRKDAVGADALIERLLAATGYEAVLLSLPGGKRMLGNVRQLVSLARASAAEGGALADFLAEMNEQVIDQSRYEQAAVAGEAEDVVRLMTIHKAKGLEFPVVVIPDLNFGHRGVSSSLLNRRDWGLTLNLAPSSAEADVSEQPDEQQPPSYRIAKALETADQRAEDIRKLYVAATRHEDHLVFVAADWRTKDGQFQRSGSFIRGMDEALGIAKAADAGRDIPYDGGRFRAAVRRLSPRRAAMPGRGGTPVQRLLARAGSAEALSEAILKRARKGPPFGRGLQDRRPAQVGPLPPEIGSAEVAVTALGDFAHCPALYRWRYELRIPGEAPARPAPGEAARALNRLDAATVGTLYHRCMERLDFAAPQRPEALVRRAAAEMGLSELADVDALSAELAGMLDGLRGHPLWQDLAGARQALRELDFIARLGPVTLRGQIDLLIEDTAGAWHVVDYKSDRLVADDVAEHADRYRLQMLTYAAAAARYLGRPPARAMLYFLRPAAVHPFDVSAAALAEAEERVAGLARSLIAAGRGGRFERRRSEACACCPYATLCRG